MRVSQAKELFRQLTKSYFQNATVIFTRQSRIAKSQLPLVTITSGNVRRPTNPVLKMVNGYETSSYQTRLTLTIDLFTHGRPVLEDGKVIGYEDSALDDMLSFADYLDSQHTIEWCHNHDVAVLIDGEAQDMTGIVNDNNYEFRSRLSVLFYFTQTAIGHAAVLQEESLLYPHVVEDESGEEVVVYTPEEPPTTESVSGAPSGKDADVDDDSSVKVEPKFEESTAGGGTPELAAEDTGYFTEVEIKEEEQG